MLTASNEFISTMNSPAPKEVYVKLEFYDRHMNFINEITKFVTLEDLANISVERGRPIRRSFSFALDNTSAENLFSWGEDRLVWIDKRVRVYIGLKLFNGDIEYVLQGTFVCTDIYESNNVNGKKTYITGQDKAFLLGDPFGKIKGIYRALVGEDLMVYPPGESPDEIKALLETHSSINFVDRLLNPQNYPNPTITELSAIIGDDDISPVADPGLIKYFSERYLTHLLGLRPSPSGIEGEDPYRVYSKIYYQGGSYHIIFDEEEASAAATSRGDFVDFPSYYDATIFMIHAFTREYFEYYQGLNIGITAPSSHLRPETTPKITDIIKWLLENTGETQPLLMDDLPQYQGDPDEIEFGTDILTRDLEYSEGTTYISIIEELAELLGCEFFYNTYGIPVLRKIDLNNFANSPVVAEFGDEEHNKHLYMGNERKLNINEIANRIHVYGGGAKDKTIIYRLVVTEEDELFQDSLFSVEKIGEIAYAHNGGQPDPVISNFKQAIYRAVFELRNKLGYSEELPITITPNYLLEPGDIIQVTDTSSGISDKYMIEKLDVPITPVEMNIECRREIRALGHDIDDWEHIQDELIKRYEESLEGGEIE